MAGISIKYVADKRMRQLYQQSGYRGRIMAGELTSKVTYDKHRNPPLSFEPFCTRSQRVAYFDVDGEKLVEFHLYRRKDGTIGASGKLDPKELIYKGVLYVVDI
jgi:hypothetical protein